jgi:hypothetical protein
MPFSIFLPIFFPYFEFVRILWVIVALEVPEVMPTDTISASPQLTDVAQNFFHEGRYQIAFGANDRSTPG